MNERRVEGKYYRDNFSERGGTSLVEDSCGRGRGVAHRHKNNCRWEVKNEE